MRQSIVKTVNSVDVSPECYTTCGGTQRRPGKKVTLLASPLESLDGSPLDTKMAAGASLANALDNQGDEREGIRNIGSTKKARSSFSCSPRCLPL